MAETFVKIPSVYPKLLELRKSTTAEFKGNKYLKETTKLRYYQVTGALHLMLLSRMVLGDATGIGKCVSEDTYINTSEGLIQIKDIMSKEWSEDNFYILNRSFNVLSMEGEFVPDLIYYSGKKKGIQVITSKGFEITGLPHHPIYVSQKNNLGYVRLDHLNTSDYVCINRKGIFPKNYVSISQTEVSSRVKKYQMPDVVNELVAELLGFFISEGSGPTDYRIHITQYEPEINERIRFLLKNLFNYVQNPAIDFDKEIKVSSKQICNFLDRIGAFTRLTSGFKRIPVTILQSPKTVISSFLRSYFEGDGRVEPNDSVSCSSKSEELIKQIQLLLLQFGIVSRRKIKRIKIKNRKEIYWVLYLQGHNIDLFSLHIGFISLKKNKKLSKIVGKNRNTNVDIIPFGNELIEEAMCGIMAYLKKSNSPCRKNSGWKGMVGYGYKRIIESYRYNRRGLTYDGLKKFISIIKELGLSDHVSNMVLMEDIYQKNVFFDKIVSLKEKESVFFDFHVPLTHNFTGNGFINHNTIQLIAAYTFLLNMDPTLKLIVLCPKSALFQWLEEFDKFTQGITCRVITNEYLSKTGFAARKAQYDAFKENVMIIGYGAVLEEYEAIKATVGSNYMVCFDEAHVFKGRKTKTFFACNQLASGAVRAYGLSATVIKNSLEEVYSIYAVIVPGLFGNITSFCKTFCQQKLMKLKINGKDRYIPKTTGYKNLHQFKQLLDPWILVRKKEEVASELPKLISRKVILEMEPEQKALYRKALSGILYEEKVKQEFFEVYDLVRNGATDEKVLKRYEEMKEKYDAFTTETGKKRGKLAALTYCQMISNGPSLLREPGESSKAIEFERLVTDELTTEKILVFTRFKSGIPDLEVICERNHIKYTKITGDILSAQERDAARIRFQTDPEYRIMFITTAGSSSLNLQAASVIIFYDTPWSYGDLVQTIGRAQRIGSIQEHVLLLHLLNEKTIDMRVIAKVTDKKDLSDEILGDTAKGALEFTETDNEINTLYEELLKDAE